MDAVVLCSCAHYHPTPPHTDTHTHKHTISHTHSHTLSPYIDPAAGVGATLMRNGKHYSTCSKTHTHIWTHNLGGSHYKGTEGYNGIITHAQGNNCAVIRVITL